MWLQWQPHATAEVLFQRYYYQEVSLPVNKRLMQPMGMVSRHHLHEESLGFVKQITEGLFYVFCDPYFRFIITKGQKFPLSLLIFSKMSWPPPLKTLIPKLPLESWKMPLQWYLHFCHTCLDICLELVSAASGEAVQLCWRMLDDRDLLQ